MDFFKHPQIEELIEKYGKETVIDNYGDLVDYINNPGVYDLITEPELRVVKKIPVINPGIKFLQGSFFPETIRLEYFDLENPLSQNSRMLLLKYMEQSSSIYLYGANGTGKTTFTIALANNLYEKYHEKFLYISWPDFIDKMKLFDQAWDFLEQVKNSKIVILDDLGNENITKYSRDEILFSVINYRLERNLETIIISNYDPEELLNRYMLTNKDHKVVTTLVSKIMGLCHPIKFNGVNYRNEE